MSNTAAFSWIDLPPDKWKEEKIEENKPIYKNVSFVFPGGVSLKVYGPLKHYILFNDKYHIADMYNNEYIVNSGWLYITETEIEEKVNKQ